MKFRLLIAAGLLSFAVMPLAAEAQGIVGGAAQGAHVGHRAAGPVGGLVGGAVGAGVGGVVGGVKGVLGVPQRHHRHRHPYYRNGRRYYR